MAAILAPGQGPHPRGEGEIPAVDEVLEADREHQKQVAIVLADRVVEAVGRKASPGTAGMHEPDLLIPILGRLLRRKLPWTDQELAEIVGRLADGLGHSHGWSYRIPVAPALGAVERATDGQPSDLTRAALARLGTAVRRRARGHEPWTDERSALDRIARLLGDTVERRLGADPWSEELADASRAGPGATFDSVLEVATNASASRPSAAFERQAGELADRFGSEPLRARLVGWLELAAEQKGDARHPVVPPETGDLLRGLVWLARRFPDAETATAVGNLAASMLTKVPYHGPRSAKVANACLSTLAEMGPAGAAQLGRLRTAAKHASTRDRLDEAITSAAGRQGVSVEELEEAMVPNFGLDSDGARREKLRDHIAELRVTGRSSVELVWLRPDGRPLKAAPRAVKEDHAESLKRLRGEVKEARTMLGAQKARLERLMAVDRTWRYDRWRERYRDHGLVGPLARRLIWRIGSLVEADALIWLEGRWIDVAGREVAEPAEDAEVRLWHPIGAEVDQVRDWRVFLEERRLTQPFKQAHREVYIVTEAERLTGTYSNRFAGHVLRQHQMAALCRERGWEYSLQGAWDSANEPTMALPRWGLTVAFWVEAPHGREATGGSGIFDYVVSDQVRFLDAAGEPVPPVDVPRLAFTEAMRDVDLFVGVCSVGNDPAWRDRGEAPQFDEYWIDYSFGDLGEQARIRREVLERLLPKLRIAGSCRIDGRFLRVEGKLRTYRIHLGSSNILMEPNDRYLCIVRDRVPAEQRSGAFVPFEGDPTLTLILSKAFLLAADEKIADPVILEQIRR